MLQEYQPRKEQERQWEISRKERQWERQKEEERSLIPARLTAATRKEISVTRAALSPDPPLTTAAMRLDDNNDDNNSNAYAKEAAAQPQDRIASLTVPEGMLELVRLSPGPGPEPPLTVAQKAEVALVEEADAEAFDASDALDAQAAPETAPDEVDGTDDANDADNADNARLTVVEDAQEAVRPSL
jgi:hypothetical protein